MDSRKYMIIDLEKKGDKRMFVTEQVVHISENNNGLWAVKFSTSQRIFNYNKSRLLYLTNPISVDLIEKGLYIKNRHITNVSELLKFDYGRLIFYHVVYNNGFTEIHSPKLLGAASESGSEVFEVKYFEDKAYRQYKEDVEFQKDEDDWFGTKRDILG